MYIHTYLCVKNDGVRLLSRRAHPPEPPRGKVAGVSPRASITCLLPAAPLAGRAVSAVPERVPPARRILVPGGGCRPQPRYLRPAGAALARPRYPPRCPRFVTGLRLPQTIFLTQMH